MIIDKYKAPIMTISQQLGFDSFSISDMIESKTLGFGVSGFGVPGFGVSDMI